MAESGKARACLFVAIIVVAAVVLVWVVGRSRAGFSLWHAASMGSLVGALPSCPWPGDQTTILGKIKVRGADGENCATVRVFGSSADLKSGLGGDDIVQTLGAAGCVGPPDSWTYKGRGTYTCSAHCGGGPGRREGYETCTWDERSN